jgi:hypothetical protein
MRFRGRIFYWMVSDIPDFAQELEGRYLTPFSPIILIHF